ncbi:hypothetical protein M422DRAFT_267988 [Sphaerobolus stellatus SS14]|uniref:Uncharacterized protein n=1 Tax=Sphaerobolus stellatus (strain SS14) TaxID=990650 RepID=A0A0C9UZD2_SPHS4|nr:hypothetical protein M422DRAFT_267988 [Sphaerobolus stellatus SS14]
MSLLTCRPLLSSLNQESIVKTAQGLIEQLRGKFTEVSEEYVHEYTPELSIIELDSLSRVISQSSNAHPATNFDLVLNFASHLRNVDLGRLTYFQQFIWALEAHREETSGSEADLLSSIRQWMSATCGLIVGESKVGSVALLEPRLLHDLFSICLDSTPMNLLERHQKRLRLEANRLMQDIRDPSLDRLTQIYVILCRATIMLAHCFKTTYDVDSWNRLVALKNPSPTELIQGLSSSNNAHFSAAIHSRLAPVFSDLSVADGTSPDALCAEFAAGSYGCASLHSRILGEPTGFYILTVAHARLYGSSVCWCA